MEIFSQINYVFVTVTLFVITPCDHIFCILMLHNFVTVPVSLASSLLRHGIKLNLSEEHWKFTRVLLYVETFGWRIKHHFDYWGFFGEKIMILEEQNDGAVIGIHLNVCSHLHIGHTPITSKSCLLVLVSVVVSITDGIVCNERKYQRTD